MQTAILVPLLAAFVSQVAFEQDPGSGAIDVSLCELAAHPDQYNERSVRIRERIGISFENFRLDASACDGRRIDGIWLYYAQGPERLPTTWCCGDLRSAGPLQMVQDEAFRDFHTAAERLGRDQECSTRDCQPYTITATLTGRFEAVPAETCDREGGWGHFGLHCARLEIQSVADVAIEPSN